MGIQISLYEWHLKKRENAQNKFILLSAALQKESPLSFLVSGRQWKDQGFSLFPTLILSDLDLWWERNLASHSLQQVLR